VIVRTFDGLQALTPPQPSWSSASSRALNLYGLSEQYAEIYKTQPNVRICVDFLSRNTAQIPLQAFRRVSDTDRIRLVDHDLARWLGKPNPATSEYRLRESLMGDLGIYFNTYLLKVRYVAADRRNGIGLVRLPPDQMRPEPQGKLLPEYFVWMVNGREREFPLSEIVYVNGYNPCNPLEGLSPMETLRRILAEEEAAGDYRETFWRKGARVPGVVTRPKELKRYGPDQLKSWREQWRAAYGGSSGEDTVLLQDGETFQQTSSSAKDSEFMAGGKLRREICAAQWHIPQPLVGILEHATFSNIREQDKHLYKHCLGPWHELIVQEFERQLLVECEDQRAVYLEFNLDAQLAGTPEERAASMRISIGRPWRTVNEGRALDNLPRIDDPELDTVAPQQGGPSDASANPDRPPDAGTAASPPAPDDTTDDTTAEAIAPILHAARLRQQARLQKIPAGARAPAFFAGSDRWNRELIEDLAPIVGVVEAERLALEANAAMFMALVERDAA
jgi:HK97 family phage portal protein